MGTITHTFVSPVVDAGDPNKVGPDEWNATHTITGTFPPDVTAQSYNRIVNGAMQHSQENGNTAGTVTGFHSADQFYGNWVSSGTFTQQRVQVMTPNGSKDRIRLTVNTADTSVAAGDFLGFQTNIEGVRLADFLYGTASAKQSILRFGFKAPAGTYSMSFRNSAANRTYIANFTISAGQANTDTEQTFVIPGDVTGTWLTDNGIGGMIFIAMALGTTLHGTTGWQAGNFAGTSAISNGMGTAGNVFELYDVGLYLDPQNSGVAPRWTMPDYGQELIACKRYYSVFRVSGRFTATGGQNVAHSIVFAPSMRVSPATAIASGGARLNFTAIALPAPDNTGGRLELTSAGAGDCYAINDICSVNARM